jgi:hypothetical protein
MEIIDNELKKSTSNLQKIDFEYQFRLSLQQNW